MPSAPNLNPPASSVAVHAAIFRHPLWALTPQKGANLNPERGSERAKCVPARTAAEFHGALNRGFAVELTREPGERTGVMVEDGGDRARDPRGQERGVRAGMEARDGEEILFPGCGRPAEKRAQRRPRNKRGFALQMCVLRSPGRLLASGKFVAPGGADFIGCRSGDELADYGARAAPDSSER